MSTQPIRRLLIALFFMSGLPALTYQLVWQRALFRIFGVNVESVTIVVAAFMIGLGLGSLAGGRLSRGRMPLLLLLAGIEAATGLFGIVSLRLFDAVGDMALGLPTAATAAITLSLVVVPTLLMGATLPVLVGYLVRRGAAVGGAVGDLYYANTLGAGAACLVGALALFPFMGAQSAVWVAAGGNFAVATFALVAWRRGGPDVAAPVVTTSTAPVAAATLSPVVILGLASAGGAVSLAWEIFLFRVTSYSSASSASSFAITLGVFLVGLASGARRASVYCERPDGLARAARAVGWAAVGGAAILPGMVWFSWLGNAVQVVAMAGLGLWRRVSAPCSPVLRNLALLPMSARGNALRGFTSATSSARH